MDLNTSNLKKFEFEEGYNFYEKLKRKNPLFKRRQRKKSCGKTFTAVI